MMSAAAVRVSARLPLGVRARGRAPGRRASGQGQGSQRNPYTAGVICAKVARYAERFTTPSGWRSRCADRPESSGAFAPVAWDDALDEVAEAFVRKVQQHGSETVWPISTPAPWAGAARRHQPPAPRHALFGLAHHDLRDPLRHRLARRLRPALGRDRRGDGALGPDRDLGHQPGEHAGQRHDPRGAGEKARGARLVVVDPYRTGTAEQADVHLALRPGPTARSPAP